MARQIPNRDISKTLEAASTWIENCLIEDESTLSGQALWTPTFIAEVRQVFVDHPDEGKDSFLVKLTGQMAKASPAACQLMAEMLWILLLFPSNIKAPTKRRQIRDIWALSGKPLPESVPLLQDNVLTGIGSGGPGFNNYRPGELKFLILLSVDLKARTKEARRQILTNYDAFLQWIEAVPRDGERQFRHMLRYFAFPDIVERISSNNDRRKILEGFGIVSMREARELDDRQLDENLLALREKLQKDRPDEILDFYSPALKPGWQETIKTAEGLVTVVIPENEAESEDQVVAEQSPPDEVRRSLQIQARLAEIGAMMGFTVWIPATDRARVRSLMNDQSRVALIEDLPLNYHQSALKTIEQIDVLWLRRSFIVRAFEVEHTTAVYSGLLRMADLLAVLPNLDIKIHIVAPEERKAKFFREMLRPIFSVFDRGPLSDVCTFLSYDSVDSIRSLEHLNHLSDGVIGEYEEPAEAT